MNEIDCIYVPDFKQKDITYLKELLSCGYVAITKKDYAVKKSDSTDDKYIEYLICCLSE